MRVPPGPPRPGSAEGSALRRCCTWRNADFHPSGLRSEPGPLSCQPGRRKTWRINICKEGEKQLRVTSVPQVLLWAGRKIERAKCWVPLAQPSQKPCGGAFPLTVTFIHGMWANCPFAPLCHRHHRAPAPRSRPQTLAISSQSNSALWMEELLAVPASPKQVC